MSILKATKPSEQQINTAIEWLLHNEGEEGESEACHAVATWLSHLIIDDDLKKFARQNGLSIKHVRKAVAKEMEK